MLRCVLFCLLAVVAHAQVFEGKTLVKASLLADTTAIVPGKPFEVGVLLKMEPGWHTYWEYAGDAGLPTSISWTLPEGFVAGPIQWPLPHRVLEPGDIEVYAYKDRILLLTAIVAPAKIPQTTVTIQAKVDWLVCAEICIPGSANLELSFPVADQSAQANAELFDEFRAILPAATAPPYTLKWTKSGTSLELMVSGLNDAKSVDLYPLPPKGEQVDHPKNGPIQDGKATIALGEIGEFRGVLVVETEGGRKGWLVSSSEQTAVGAGIPAQVSASGSHVTGLWRALLFGFIGGLILNLMPCVLPVISLKIFGFIRQAGDHP
ncbi:MAG TPA: protein-disulfide reductase DsbD domain-containing protein, partial [Terriglobia bacterium]|nr:protein-disulfide reductase DsbD domain-containing protein [Terriglobia bacterium]